MKGFKGLYVLTAVIITMMANVSYAQSLPVPRFVSLSSTEVNLRTGPGTRYPIQWVYTKSGLPVEVINEFDTWRKIRDIQGDEGWVHQSMLSGRRFGIVRESDIVMTADKDPASTIIARLEPGVLVEMDTCLEVMCHAKVHQYEGWVNKTALWGVYPQETFD